MVHERKQEMNVCYQGRNTEHNSATLWNLRHLPERTKNPAKKIQLEPTKQTLDMKKS